MQQTTILLSLTTLRSEVRKSYMKKISLDDEFMSELSDEVVGGLHLELEGGRSLV